MPASRSVTPRLSWTQQPSTDCWSRSFWKHTPLRRRRWCSIWMPPTIHSTANRKDASHGYYGHYCYLPLYIFAGDHLLCARLRPANTDASAGSREEVGRIVQQIRARWPEVRILLRADSGFCRDDLMSWCEANQIHYVFGLARNQRLRKSIDAEMAQARALHEQTQQAVRVFTEFVYETHDSWSRARRVVAKAEHLSKGENPRFVVTSLDAAYLPAQPLYEQLYCGRGEMENRIKEQFSLFSDRTSTAYLRSNQLRLYLSSIAYLLLEAFRRLGLNGTAMARAQCQTIRLKLLRWAHWCASPYAKSGCRSPAATRTRRCSPVSFSNSTLDTRSGTVV